MKEGVKTIDKYELLQQQTKIKDGVKIIAARHSVQDKLYTLKKIKVDDQNKSKYTALLN